MDGTPCRAALLVAALIAGTAHAAATAKAPAKAVAEPVDDLSVPVLRHVARCPLPKAGACVIRKPVDSGYRVLTPSADLEDRGDHWVADFSKLKDAKALLRVLGRNGDMHEIEVSFGKTAGNERGPK